MAKQAQQQLLAELMETMTGPSEDLSISFFHDSVCKLYLCGLCPNELFIKLNWVLFLSASFEFVINEILGSCRKKHNIKLKQQYEEAVASGEFRGYEDELRIALQHFVADCDKKIISSQRRLDKPSEDPKVNTLTLEIKEISEEIIALTEEIEKAGEEGDLEKSMSLLSMCEEKKLIKGRKEVQLTLAKYLKADLEVIEGGNSQTQKLRVCDVCSAYLSVTDNDRRLADHFGGKMHKGYSDIRDKLKELNMKRDVDRNQDDGARGVDEAEQRDSRYRPRDVYHDRERIDRHNRHDRDYQRGGYDDRRYPKDNRDQRRSRSPRRR
ncbi:putative RNA-binding protein Luc7-like 1, partial [Nowakowskiella sp. JEL0078]